MERNIVESIISDIETFGFRREIEEELKETFFHWYNFFKENIDCVNRGILIDTLDMLSRKIDWFRDIAKTDSQRDLVCTLYELDDKLVDYIEMLDTH